MINRVLAVSDLLNFEGMIEVETNISDKGLPIFEISGLISKSIDESKKRIITSLENSGFNFPLKNILVNLSPAYINKSGTHYDLPIAVSIIKDQILIPEPNSVFIGELSIDGRVKEVDNIFFLVMNAVERGYRNIYIPLESSNKFINIDEVNIYPIGNLHELRTLKDIKTINIVDFKKKENEDLIYPRIEGNEKGKKVISYCLIGSHSLHIQGPPGVGKSMLVKSMRDLAPNLVKEDAIKVSKIYSYSGISRENEFFSLPFRNPHPLTSYSSMFGSYTRKLQVGEVSLANKGILFLDEFPEFNRLVIEGLRGPLEDKKVNLSRSGFKVELESDFILAVTSNPCKCGYFNHSKKSCSCNPIDIKRYQSRISGPIEDRIDIKLYINEFNSYNDNEVYKYSFLDYENLKKHIEDKIRLRCQMLFTDKSTKYSLNLMCNNIIQKYFPLKLYNIFNNELKNTSISDRGKYKIVNLIFTICLFNNRDLISMEDVIEGMSLYKNQFNY